MATTTKTVKLKNVKVPEPDITPQNNTAPKQATKNATTAGTKVLDTTPAPSNNSGGLSGQLANTLEAYERLKEATAGSGIDVSPERLQDNGAFSDNPNSGSGTSQSGGYGNAAINPYSNAYAAYETSMNKVKQAQLGQLNTEYNNQQKQIEGAYQNLGRNAYVTYMNRIKQNEQAASNMGANRTGMAEAMHTANAADYNRSVGNAGAYRQINLSNAENAYNSNVAGVENEYATNLANAKNQYAQLEIQRQNELADLQANLNFQAEQNALNREQQAKEAERAYQQQVQAYNDQKMLDTFNRFAATVTQYTSDEAVEKKMNDLKDRKKAGTLNDWEKEYYDEMLDTLRMRKAEVKSSKKK